jgi:hypothetical protein
LKIEKCVPQFASNVFIVFWCISLDHSKKRINILIALFTCLNFLTKNMR